METQLKTGAFGPNPGGRKHLHSPVTKHSLTKSVVSSKSPTFDNLDSTSTTEYKVIEHKHQGGDPNYYESALGNSDSRRGAVVSESEANRAWERMCPSMTDKM